MIFAPIAALGAAAIVAGAYFMGYEHGSAEHEVAAQQSALERAKQTVERQAKDIAETEAARKAGDEKIETLISESDARVASIRQAHEEAVKQHIARADAAEAGVAACSDIDERRHCLWDCTLPELPETEAKRTVQ